MIVIVYTDITHRHTSEALAFELERGVGAVALVRQRDEFLAELDDNYRYRAMLHIMVDIHHFSKVPLEKYLDQYIVYNWVATTGTGKIFRAAHLVDHAVEVWDFNADNLTHLSRWETKTRYVPFGCSRFYEFDQPVEKTIDLLFIGGLTPHRNRLLDRLREQLPGVTIEIHDGVYGDERKRLIKSSRIVLNIYKHPSYRKSFASTRFTSDLSLGAFILSEASEDRSLAESYDGAIVQVPYDEIADRVRHFLDHPEERVAIATEGFRRSRNRLAYSEFLPIEKVRDCVFNSPELTRIRTHFERRLLETVVDTERFPYGVVDGIFPADFYQRLISDYPDTGFHQKMYNFKKVGKEKLEKYHQDQRFTIYLTEREKLVDRPWWTIFSYLIQSDWFKHTLVDKLHRFIQPFVLEKIDHLEVIGYLNQDHRLYANPPHTDSASKLITTLFYFPPDDSRPELGTAIYDSPLRSVESTLPNQDMTQFTRLKTVEYLPNRMLFFLKTDRSWHGVEGVTEEMVRWTSQNFLAFRKLGKKKHDRIVTQMPLVRFRPSEEW